jgi:thioesterase domain-containing protein
MTKHARLYRDHVAMARLYAPAHPLARAVVFDPQDSSRDGHGPFVDWAAVCADVVRVRIPGNHYSMLRPPNVRDLARALSERLVGSHSWS